MSIRVVTVPFGPTWTKVRITRIGRRSSRLLADLVLEPGELRQLIAGLGLVAMDEGVSVTIGAGTTSERGLEQ